MEQDKTGESRNDDGTFKDGVSGNPNGRPATTDEEKAERKATNEDIKEYKDKLADALPKLSPVLIKKAEEGDLPAIKEINDRVMGKSPQPQEHSGELRVLVVPDIVAEDLNEDE